MALDKRAQISAIYVYIYTASIYQLYSARVMLLGVTVLVRVRHAKNLLPTFGRRREIIK